MSLECNHTSLYLSDIEPMISDINAAEQVIGKIENAVTFFGSARLKSTSEHYKKAEELSKKLSHLGINIITGGGDGIMEAANKGAFLSKSSESIGLNIILPFEQKINKFTTKNMTFKHFFTRKNLLIKHSKAFVIFAGGFGTLDELFEVLMMLQTKTLTNKLVYLIGESFWKPLDDFIKSSLLDEKTIKEEDLNLYKITDDLDLIVKEIASFKF